MEIEVKERDNETIYPNWYTCEALKEWKNTINYLNFTPEIASFTEECNKLIGCKSDPINLVALDDIIRCRKVILWFIPFRIRIVIQEFKLEL